MAGKIFINYRRGDDPGFTQALLGRLDRVFSAEQLFIDVDNIEPGLDFVRVLEEQVSKCDVVLAVIGKGWLDARDERNARRLDNPEDFVRVEITSALIQDKRVIPVLVGDAPMPRSDELPDALKPLATRNAVRLTHERFRADADGLVKALQNVLENAESRRKAKELEAQQVQAEQGRRLEQEAEALRKSDEARLARETEDRQYAENAARLSREVEARRIEEQDRRDAEEAKRDRPVEPQQKGEAERPQPQLDSEKQEPPDDGRQTTGSPDTKWQADESRQRRTLSIVLVGAASIIAIAIIATLLAFAAGRSTNADLGKAQGTDNAQRSGAFTPSGRPVLNFDQARPPSNPLPQPSQSIAAPDKARPSGKLTNSGRPVLTFDQ
jgi:hypothetical protein